MPLLAPSLDYTDKDFDSLRARLFQLIAAAYPAWSDQSVANFGNILIEAHAFVGDVLGFYQDKQARETRWSTATQMRSMLSLVKLIGYRPSGRQAASVVQTFTLAAPMAGTVTLPAGTVVSTREVADPVRYQLLEPLVIPAGATTAEASVENSETEVDILGSSGLANQSFTLSRVPYVDHTAVVTAANGEFVEVQNFLQSTATDRHFVVVADQNDRARVTFGNGINGVVPTGTITVTYRTGGGAAGVVDAGTLSKIEGSFTDAFGTTATVSTTNAQRSVGGYDRQSVNSIRTLAPEAARVSESTVAREDYEIAARKVSGVARALMVTRDVDVGVPENSGFLCLVPPDSGAVSQATIDAVRAQFVLRPYSPTFDLSIITASYLVVNVSVRIQLEQSDDPVAFGALVKARVIASLATFFRAVDAEGVPNPLVDFGFNRKASDGTPAPSLAWSDVHNVIRDTAGVRAIDPGAIGCLLNGARENVAIAARQFPKLGTVTVVDADRGVQL